jgi:ribosomal protein S18 acetylase RimI-like enzyme
MTKKDLPAVKLLMQSIPNFWHKAWNDATLKRALSASDKLSFVYEVNKQIVAVIFCYDVGFRAYLGEFAVSEKTQGCGIGKKLLQHVEDILKRRKCELIISDVWKSAEPFYRKLGWQAPQALLLGKKLVQETEKH